MRNNNYRKKNIQAKGSPYNSRSPFLRLRRVRLRYVYSSSKWILLQFLMINVIVILGIENTFAVAATTITATGDDKRNPKQQQPRRLRQPKHQQQRRTLFAPHDDEAAAEEEDQAQSQLQADHEAKTHDSTGTRITAGNTVSSSSALPTNWTCQIMLLNTMLPEKSNNNSDRSNIDDSNSSSHQRHHVIMMEELEETGCIPIMNQNTTTDDLWRIDLPLELLHRYHHEIVRGDFYVQVTGAILVQDELIVAATSVKAATTTRTAITSTTTTNQEEEEVVGAFRVIPRTSTSLHHHVKSGQERRLSQQDNANINPAITTSNTMGIKTIAVVRITTADSEPVFSEDELRRGLFGSGPGIHNIQTQFEACSFGQLQWKLADIPVPSPPPTQITTTNSVSVGTNTSDNGAGDGGSGVISVHVNQLVSEFTSPGMLVKAAQTEMHTALGIDDISLIADKVLMCLPPGTGDPLRPWLATAGMNHWRAYFNNEWCMSLTATMHEVGHLIGLTHSNENAKPYDDYTGYMSRGTPERDWPLKCFNGHKNWLLGWYESRHYTIDPDPLVHGAKLLKLAAFVDYNMTNWSDHVIINVADTYFLLYNRATKFNIHTEEKRDQVTITEHTGGSSDARAGLSVGQRFEVPNFRNETESTSSSSALIIEVCEHIPKINHDRPDLMLVSIGMGVSLCGQPYVDEPWPSAAPSSAPTLTPAPTTSKPSSKPSSKSTSKSSSKPTGTQTQPLEFGKATIGQGTNSFGNDAYVPFG